MSKLADMEKKENEGLTSFQVNLSAEVKTMLVNLSAELKTMLADFSKARIEMARTARDERKAFLLGLKNQVLNLSAEVKTMLADFSKVRIEMAKTARDERRAFLLGLKNQVRELCGKTGTPDTEESHAAASQHPLATSKPKSTSKKTPNVKAVKPYILAVEITPKLEEPKVVEEPEFQKLEPEELNVEALPKVEPPKIEKAEEPKAEVKVAPLETTLLNAIGKNLDKQEKDFLREKFGKAVARSKRAKKK